MFLLERVSDALLRLARGELPDLLNPPAPNVSEEVARLVDATNNIIKEYANARSFLMSLSEGSLDVDPPPRNFLISPFKQLHSNLRHLTWQTQQVSKGDLSQQVDFLGDFSLAFNSMIDSLKEKRRIEEALRKSHEDLKSANTLIMESIEYASSI
ncbi:MAG: HAMP domain-containing protein [Desulfomonilaceae bacterium]